MARRRLASVVAVVGFVVSLSIPATVAADTPFSLSGEFLAGEGENLDVTGSCSRTGTSSITYSVSGEAVGPYPGTFTEVGTVTIGQTETGGFSLGFPIKQVTTLEAFFTIDSGVGQVTGSKRLIEQSNVVQGLCEDFTDYLPPGFGSTISGSYQRICACAFGLSYEALI